MTITTYSDALDFLYSFVDYSLTRNLRYSPDKFNLDRMKQFMQVIGNPHTNYPIIHVAGTKGKGSTSAMITSILSEAGYRVGFYSSPHMVKFTERIKIGNEEISQQQLTSLVNELEKSVMRIGNLTTFEITTAIALKYFQNMKVDAAVVEVGMGGRLDATNVVDPVVSVITSISHDHTKFLGNTLVKIALEKAGIMKENKPVIIGRQKGKIGEILVKEARQKKAIPILVQDNYCFSISSHDLFGQKIVIRQKFVKNQFRNEKIMPFEAVIPLLGRHQAENALNAYCAIQTLRDLGFKVPQNAIRRGFEVVNWPGRFEVIHHKPLIIVDSAHNPDSFRKLRATIKDYIPNKKINFLFAASEDKAIKKMLEIIKPYVGQLIITRTSHPRAANICDILEAAKELGYKDIKYGEFDVMISDTLNSTNQSEVIVAAGSIFLAGAIKEIFQNN